jgi:hypothetical protein
VIEFKPWPKIARLNRDIVITEKIDGTNAAVGIVPACGIEDPCNSCLNLLGEHMTVYAQSRTRLITPEKDNFGFARWVADHADVLRERLGPGLHFGEWWGNGIQRGYGLANGDRRFSLFNVARYGGNAEDGEPLLLGIDGDAVRTVPVLYEGPFDANWVGGSDMTSTRDVINTPVTDAIWHLRTYGSMAAPGFMKPEGIVIYHTAASTMFKVTLEGDEKPKGVAA